MTNVSLEKEDRYAGWQAEIIESAGEPDFPIGISEQAQPLWVLEAEVGRCAIGYAVVLSADEGEPFSITELSRLYLFHRFHGLGLGKRLMNEVRAHARASRTRMMTLRVNSQNAGDIRFYEQFGFSVVSKESFRAGERDYRVLVMRLAFSERG